jgi:hypothetical protein
MAAQSLRTDRTYSIALMKNDSQWCVYHVRIKSGIERNFYVEAASSRIPPGDAIKRIQLMCEANFESLPEDWGIIYFDLNVFSAAA